MLIVHPEHSTVFVEPNVWASSPYAKTWRAELCGDRISTLLVYRTYRTAWLNRRHGYTQRRFRRSSWDGNGGREQLAADHGIGQFGWERESVPLVGGEQHERGFYLLGRCDGGHIGAGESGSGWLRRACNTTRLGT